MTAIDTVFGHWLMTAAGLDHYFLKGKSLCGASLRGGEKRPLRADANVEVGYRCPMCHRLNLERWSKL